MKPVLDYNPANQAYFLTLPAKSADVSELMRVYGLDYNMVDSNPTCDVLSTRSLFAAASFLQFATQSAMEGLGWVAKEVAASMALDSGRHLTMPYDKELIGFQKADCDYILSRTHAFDADEPGLGKTPTTVVVANEMQAQRVLCVVPAGLRAQWCRRIRDWSTIPGNVLDICEVKVSRMGISSKAHWTVISYNLIRNKALLRALLRQGRYDLLIFDEARYLKEMNSATTRAAFGWFDGRQDDGESLDNVYEGLAEVSDRVLCLDGTPIPNRPSEIYVFLRALCWQAADYGSQRNFRERFNPQSKGKTTEGKVWTHEEDGRLPELQNRLRSYFMCRHLMPQVRHQLAQAFPDPIYDLIVLEETGPIKAALNAEKMLGLDPNMMLGNDFTVMGEISTVRLEMGVAMVPQVIEHVDLVLDSGERKLVIFTWHKEVNDLLSAALRQRGWKVTVVDGRNNGNKDKLVQQFITDPTIDVLVGNILTLGTGTDGVQYVSNHCLFAESDWVPGNNDQAVKRLARFGQQSYVRADFFVVHDSMSAKVLGTSLGKMDVIHHSLDITATEVLKPR